MKAKMIADYRKKPSRARQEAARRELDAYVDRELAKLSATRIGFDPAFPDTFVIERAGVYEASTTVVSSATPKPKEPLPMLAQPEREVTTFRGGKWAKPEKEQRRRR